MNIETTRRAFIGGTAAMAAVAASPAVAIALPADRKAWEHAMARFQVAKVEFDAFAAVFDEGLEGEMAFEAAHGVVHMLPNGDFAPNYFAKRKALQAEHGTAYLVPDHMHERMEALSEAMGEAEMAALNTPAPDLAALRWKLDRLTVDAGKSDGDMPPWAGHVIRQTLLDIARLLPPGR